MLPGLAQSTDRLSILSLSTSTNSARSGDIKFTTSSSICGMLPDLPLQAVDGADAQPDQFGGLDDARAFGELAACQFNLLGLSARSAELGTYGAAPGLKLAGPSSPGRWSGPFGSADASVDLLDGPATALGGQPKLPDLVLN